MSEYDYVIYTDKKLVRIEDTAEIVMEHPKKVATCDTFKNAVIKLAKLKVGNYLIVKVTRSRK